MMTMQPGWEKIEKYNESGERMTEGDSLQHSNHQLDHEFNEKNMFTDKIIKEVKENFKLTDGIIVILTALVSGYLTKKLYVAGSRNPVKRMIGELFLIGVTNFVANHPDEVKMAGRMLINFVGKKMGVKTNEVN